MPHFHKFLSVLCTKHSFRTSNYVNRSCHILEFLRFCRTERAVNTRIGEISWENRNRLVRREAEAALLEYLHVTRNLQFLDAENMSKKSPEFLDRLLQTVGVDDDGDVSQSVTRFLRYHPINEFEPFFESIGLKSCDYSLFIPRNLMYLSDDKLLLRNYYVLCNYGVPRVLIGNVYKEATEVFRYDDGVLQSKLQNLQDLGLSKSLVVKIVASSPYLLRGDVVDQEFLEFLEKLKNAGVQYDWLDEHILEGSSYNWKSVVELMCLFGELGLTGEALGEVITNHPDLLHHGSGHYTFRVVVFLLKVGSTQSDLREMFLQFPRVSVVNFIHNLCQCYNFLVDVKMPVKYIYRMFRLHPLTLGSCKLKKVQSLRCLMKCGKQQIREMIKDNPNVLKKWVVGVRVDKLQELNRPKLTKMESEFLRTKFLSSVGYVEESREMEKALNQLRGSGTELQDRFDCLVKAGLCREVVTSMVKVAPQIINQSKGVIERKVASFVGDLGYPLSDLVTYPELICYTVERVKLRVLMYEWLRDEGALSRKLAVSSLLACSEDIFVKSYVNSHPRGLEFWKILKKIIISS
ncbi:hypothetical protein ACS0TY_031669 [Phlomoides rotata]